jgi:hypothetical protein
MRGPVRVRVRVSGEEREFERLLMVPPGRTPIRGVSDAQAVVRVWVEELAGTERATGHAESVP